MKIEDMRDMSDVELDQQINQMVDELFNLRMRGAHEQLENPMQIRHLRRDKARVMTVKRERELERARAEES